MLTSALRFSEPKECAAVYVNDAHLREVVELIESFVAAEDQLTAMSKLVSVAHHKNCEMSECASAVTTLNDLGIGIHPKLVEQLFDKVITVLTSDITAALDGKSGWWDQLESVMVQQSAQSRYGPLCFSAVVDRLVRANPKVILQFVSDCVVD